jgi:serine/threonine-protein kinase
MGEIFLAKQRGPEGFEKLLVIKRILSHHLDKKDYLHMFFSEAKLVARLNHHNIIQIHEMGEIEGDHYIAMEYVRGKSLRDVIDELRAEGRAMPVAHVVDLGIKLCEGLGYAHQARDIRGRPMNIVHRDINPHNILISYTGDLKLIDFGIAKSEMTSVHTATGTIKGKFVYMSPEQSAADPLDKRSDIFSLGIVLYEMLALENPFVRQNVVLSLEAIQRQPVTPPSERRRDAAALDQVLLRALEKSPEGRFQSAIEMRDALRDLVRSGAVPQPESDLSTFLHTLFSADIAEEDRLLAEADRAARSLPPPPAVPATLVSTDTDELVEAPVQAPSAFLDEEPTVAGDPSDLAQRSLEVSQQLPPRSDLSPPEPPRAHAGTDQLARNAPPAIGPGGTSSAVAASGVVGTGAGAPAPSPEPAPRVTAEARPLAPAAPKGDGLRVAVYALVFVLTIAAGFFGTRILIGARSGAELVPIPAESPVADGPKDPVAARDAAPASSPVPPPPVGGAARTPEASSDPPKAPERVEASNDAAQRERPRADREARRPRRPSRRDRGRRRRRPAKRAATSGRNGAGASAASASASDRPPRRGASSPPETPTKATSPQEASEPEAPDPALGRLRVSSSAPLSVVADGRSLGASPASYTARREAGELVLSGGRDVDYTITLAYRVTASGLGVRVESAPWSIVKRDGLSLGRTPQRASAAARHVFAFIRPGQSAPLAVTLTWRPE